jgi:hypothetical protein
MPSIDSESLDCNIQLAWALLDSHEKDEWRTFVHNIHDTGGTHYDACMVLEVLNSRPRPPEDDKKKRRMRERRRKRSNHHGQRLDRDDVGTNMLEFTC